MTDNHDNENIPFCAGFTPGDHPEHCICGEPARLHLSAEAQKLKGRREALGLTQDALAKRLGSNQTTIGRWETDAAAPNWTTLGLALDFLEAEKRFKDIAAAVSVEYAGKLRKYPNRETQIIHEYLIGTSAHKYGLVNMAAAHLNHIRSESPDDVSTRTRKELGESFNLYIGERWKGNSLHVQLVNSAFENADWEFIADAFLSSVEGYDTNDYKQAEK